MTDYMGVTMEGRNPPVRTARAVAGTLLCILLSLVALPPPSAGVVYTLDLEPTNDTMGGAPNADPFKGQALIGAVGSPGDAADWYRLHAATGEVINASMKTLDPALLDAAIELYNPFGLLSAFSNTTYEYESLATLAVASGGYYLKVYSTGGSGDYLLDIRTAAPPVLEPGAAAAGTVYNSSSRAVDFYRIFLNGSDGGSGWTETVSATVAGQGGPGTNMDLELVDLWGPDDNRFSRWLDVSWSTGQSERIAAAATYTGWYYLKVSAFTGGGSYTLNFTKSSVRAWDGDSVPASARPLNSNATVRDSLDMASDRYDWYSVYLFPGEAVDAALFLTGKSGPDGIYELGLYDGRFARLARAANYITAPYTSLTSQARFSFTAPVSGTYYLMAAPLAATADGVDLNDGNPASGYALSLTFHRINHPPYVWSVLREIYIPMAAATEGLDLSTVFADDDGVRGDTLSYRFTPAGHIGMGLAGGSRVIFTPETGWSGRQDVVFTATDTAGASASLPITVVVERVNHPPSALVAEVPVSLYAGSWTQVDLSFYFSDPDLAYGDALVFDSGGNGTISTEVNGTGLRVAAPAAFTGGGRITCTAYDRAGRAASLVLNVSVRPVPEPAAAVITPGPPAEEPSGEAPPAAVPPANTPPSIPQSAILNPQPAPVWSPARAAGSTVAATFSVWFVFALLFGENWRYGLLKFMVVPLYTKLKRDEVLDNFTRGRLYGMIEDNPGIHYTQLKRKAGLGNSTLAFHLAVLEREEFVRSELDGAFKRFYPRNAQITDEVMDLSVVQQRILHIVRNSPGVTQTEIADAAGVSKRVVNYHIDMMARALLLRVERDGKRTRCYEREDSGPPVSAADAGGKVEAVPERVGE